MQFRVLGPLEVLDEGRAVDLGGRRQRALLACLLIHANQVVAAERLVEELWGESSGGVNALQVALSRLRRALGVGDRLLRQPPGYLVRVSPGELDRDEFERLYGEAEGLLELGRAAEAAGTLRSALALWRGPPFVDFLYEPFAQAEIARLEEARLACQEKRIEADLALGRHGGLIGELETMMREHPLRERPRGQLMLALYRAGRQADALELYRQTRELFDHELGIEPSPALRRIEAAILRQDAELELPEPTGVTESDEAVAFESPRPLAAVRKTVTVLVIGLGDPAERAPDPELVRRLGEQTLAAFGPVLEGHGATLERLGDGRVMAVFGVPVAHEDDALRAVRAAVQLTDASGHEDTVRAGMDSGEVLTGDTISGQPLVAGGVVDAAASLQQRSDAGEILLGEATRRLVRDATRCEPLELDEGRTPAWRLLELLPGAPPFQRRFDAPLVGRDRELAQLCQAFERARHERRAQLFTVFGEAGIGKTRLAQELARTVEPEAAVLTGRCLSYGEGITYWPVREIVLQACGGRAIRELVDEDPDAEAVAARLESAIGSGSGGAVGEEIFWAFRKLIEALADNQPLVLVFEDVHWGEPTLLDLIEHLAEWTRSAAVLLLCLARPELLDGRPGWAGGKLNASSMLLEPLSGEESLLLVSALSAGTEVSAEATRRIADAAEGNPLFLEQMLAMVADDDSVSEVDVPPAIQALLATRLDQLTPDERDVMACASIEGELFHVGAVVELARSGARETVTLQLRSLVRKELIRAALPTLPREDAFGFRHALIRDAAYASLPKQARSDLHERYADWLERTLGDSVVQAEEFLAYHLEQACLYSAELGNVDARSAARACRALTGAGRSALRRGDTRAVVNLLERARVLPGLDERARLEPAPDLGSALFHAGDLEQAEAVLSETIASANAIGEEHIERHAWLVREFLRLFARPDLIDVPESIREAEESLLVLENVGGELELTRASMLLAALHPFGDAVRQRELAERALEYARRAGSRPDESWMLAFLGYTLLHGPTSAEEGARICGRLLTELESDPLGQATVQTFLASFLALQGNFDDARAVIASSRATTREFGGTLVSPLEFYGSATVETLADDLTAAEQAARAAAEHSAERGDDWMYVIAALHLARTVCDRGRPAESLCILDESEQHPSPPDLEITAKRATTRALALARLGRLGDAEAHAREAVTRAQGTDFLGFHADALVVLAEILRHTHRPSEAASALEEALALYARKGNVVLVATVRALLEEVW